MVRLKHLLSFALLFFYSISSLQAQKEFGFDNARSSGQPYLKPEESLKRLHVPPEFEVKLFAAEPDVINPISFTIDERGRLWVVECYEYPKRTAPGKKPRDRIKVLEATTGNGRADKVTVWAAGKDLPVTFDLASGIEVGHGGVFLGAAPYLFFLRDTKGAGRCDEQKILLQGFGSQDSHEVLNTLQWGPEGYLYGLQGIFTHSKVGEVQLNAAVWRYHVPNNIFDIFAEGTSNPWGLDFDIHGQALLTACVIPHAFHMIPGGTYIRQAGSTFNPYSFGLLHEISDHLHHQESGWAHAGAMVLQGEQIPEAYRNSLLMGSIHGCSIKRDILEMRGSTFVARHAPDFLTSDDKNFRPINLRWGPDGSIYLIDWHDQNPCHQASPDSWDMTHGRIYKIQRKGNKPIKPPDLATFASADLVRALQNNNPWWHRTALRILSERKDKSVVPALRQMAIKGVEGKYCLRALWCLYAIGEFDDTLAFQTLSHPSPWVRAWAVRLLGEPGSASAALLNSLTELACHEKAPQVRLQLACTSLRLKNHDILPLLQNLMGHEEDAVDPNIPLMIWLAYEPRVVANAAHVLQWLRTHAGNNNLINNEIIPRVMRRLVATGKRKDLDSCLAFLTEVQLSNTRRCALEGLLQALQQQSIAAPSQWKMVFPILNEDPRAEVRRLAQRLAAIFRDPQAVRLALATANNKSQSEIGRIEAIRDLAFARSTEALPGMVNILTREDVLNVRLEACRSLANYDSVEVARTVLASWKNYPPALRSEVINLLSTRKLWAAELLAAIEAKRVARIDVNQNTILQIRAFRDPVLNKLIESAWGKVRDTPGDLEALIAGMRTRLYQGPASFERGRKVFANQCEKCHRFEGRGHDVGPNLDGAARDIDYLLVNILDPNRVVGQPYFTRFVVLNNGRVETGLLVAEDARTVTLKNENDAIKIIQKSQIDEMTVQPKSLMPEGLNKTMTDQDFRDLVRYMMANPFLTDVKVAGPLASQSDAPVNSGGALKTGVSWARPTVGPPGKIPLPATHQKGLLKSYVAVTVTAPFVINTRLQLGATNLIQTWINGQLIYKGTPAQGRVGPDQASVPVQLRSGTNNILLEITYSGDKEVIYARFLDPQRKLHYPTNRR